MKSVKNYYIPARSRFLISGHLSGRMKPKKTHSFLSNFDNNESLVQILSYTFHEQMNAYHLEVFNESTNTLFIPKGQILGIVVQHGTAKTTYDHGTEFDILEGSDL